MPLDWTHRKASQTGIEGIVPVNLPSGCVEPGCKEKVLRLGRCVTHLREFEQAARDNLGLETPPALSLSSKLSPRHIQPKPAPKPVPTSRTLEISQHRQCADQPLPYKYLSPEEVQATRRYAPRWLWLYKVLEEMPVGMCAVEVKVPENIPIQRFRNMLGTAIRMHKTLIHDRWTVRKTLDGDAVVIAKVGTWKEHDEAKKAADSESTSPCG